MDHVFPLTGKQIAQCLRTSCLACDLRLTLRYEIYAKFVAKRVSLALGAPHLPSVFPTLWAWLRLQGISSGVYMQKNSALQTDDHLWSSAVLHLQALNIRWIGATASADIAYKTSSGKNIVDKSIRVVRSRDGSVGIRNRFASIGLEE